MRKQIWRMAAAVVGTIALAAVGIAQTPVPMPPTAVKAAPQAVAPAPIQPTPIQPAPGHVHPAPGYVQPAPGYAQPAPGYAPPAPGHVPPGYAHPAPVAGGGCGPAAGGYGPSHNGKWADHLFIGAGTANPVGCGCHASEKTFAFGSCKQFFSPGKTCDGAPMQYNRCGGHGHCGGLFGGHNRANCPLPTYAWPYGQPANSCHGPFSYLDR